MPFMVVCLYLLSQGSRLFIGRFPNYYAINCTGARGVTIDVLR